MENKIIIIIVLTSQCTLTEVRAYIILIDFSPGQIQVVLLKLIKCKMHRSLQSCVWDNNSDIMYKLLKLYESMN